MVNRRAIITSFIILEFIMLLVMVLLAAWLAKVQTPVTKIVPHSINDALEVSILAPKKILWDQDEPVPVIVNLHFSVEREQIGAISGGVCQFTEGLIQTLTPTATATATQMITQTAAVTQTPANTTSQEILSPFLISVDSQLLLAIDDGTDTLDWVHQVEIDPCSDSSNIKLLIRRVEQDSGTQNSTDEDRSIPENEDVFLDIEVESKHDAAQRRFFTQFVKLGPFPITFLIGAIGLWLNYQRQSDEQSRKKLEELQKLSREEPGTVDLLEAFIFHSQRVSKSSESLIEDFNQLGKVVLDPDNLLAALSSAYEDSLDTGERLLEKLVKYFSSKKRSKPDKSSASGKGKLHETPLMPKLEAIAEPRDKDQNKADLIKRLKQVLELWDTYKLPAHGLVICKIRRIWEDLPEDKRPEFNGEFTLKGRRQLYLHPFLRAIEEGVPDGPWYNSEAFPYQDVFASLNERIQEYPLGNAKQFGRRGHRDETEIEYEQLEIIDLLRVASPFSDYVSPFCQHAKPMNAWTPPSIWHTLTKERDTRAEQHIVVISQHTWDVHAALCQYANDLNLVEKNRSFPVPLNIPAYISNKDERLDILKIILTALAEGWAGLLAVQPVAFLNLSEAEKMLLMELGIWAAGSFSAWESWLLQKTTSYQLKTERKIHHLVTEDKILQRKLNEINNNQEKDEQRHELEAKKCTNRLEIDRLIHQLEKGRQTLQQLLKRMATIAEQTEQPSDPEIIPSQVDRWLTLRPAKLYKTYLVFTLPDPIASVTQKTAFHKELDTLFIFVESLTRYQIYLRGFVQSSYLGKSVVNVTQLPLDWSKTALLAAMETRFTLFRNAMNPAKPLHHFGNLFAEFSPMAVYSQGEQYPNADIRLARAANGSLGRLVNLGQSLIRILTENDDLDYLEESHIESLERNSLDESA